MKMYKGFDENLKCRDFQFEVGKEYEEEKAELCNLGFHACEFPLDVLNYYPPSTSRFCEVELDANEEKNDKDTKRVGKRIAIKAEIGLPGLIKAGVEYIEERVDWGNAAAINTGDRSAAINTGFQSVAINTGFRSAAINTGDRSVATNTGFRSAAINTGDRSVATNTGFQSVATNTRDRSATINTGFQSVATNTGDRSAAINTGEWSVATNTGFQSVATNTGFQSVATNTGDRSAATAEGKESVAIATGRNAKAKGSLGCFIVLADWREMDGEWHITNMKSAKIDGKFIKPDTFYKLEGGKFIEIEND
jgi:hypothetical protein